MSDDIFNQIGNIIAKNLTSGVPKDAPEWSAFLSNPVKTDAEKQEIHANLPENTPDFQVHDPGVCAETDQITSTQTQTAPQQFQSIDDLLRYTAGCRKCKLAQTRKNLVFGEGNPHAELMFIGEAPGADEDISGRPFVGRAGQLLDKMITAMQFSREEIYIANILKCRPPFNRNPEPDEVSCCIQYLEQQISLINPKCIVLLGAVATKYLLKHESGVSKIRGTWQSYNNIPVMVTYHPSYLLRTESAKKDAWNDLQKVMAKFGKYHKKG